MGAVQVTRIALAGGQDRLRQLILYVAKCNENAPYFGRTKLNKILWRADFSAYRERQKPVTGREYQRLEHGPAPREMRPLLTEMLERGELREENLSFRGGKVEKRPIANVEANLAYFDEADMGFVEAAIEYYWEKTGQETSDDSHGIAWKTRQNGDPMPYGNAFLSDQKLSDRQLAGLKSHIERLGLETK